MRAASIRRRSGRTDSGFTLIELTIAIALSLLIGGVIVAALITSLNVASSTSDQISDSTDAGLITAFLTRDAQSVGATVPSTAIRDTTVGVSTTDWGACTQGAFTLVVRMSWVEHTTALAQSKVVVTYALDSTNAQLTRRLCRDSTTGADLVLGRDLVSVVASCDTTSCAGTPTSISLVVTGSGTKAPLAYTLKASLRLDTQATPTVVNSAPVPLLALGAGSTVACPNLAMSGTGAITVAGNVLVDSSCGATPISGTQANLKPTGTTSTIAGIVDPFVPRVAPTFTCPGTGTNPTVGVSASASTVVVYPQAVNVTVATVFQPGRFIFCQGLTFTSGRITGTDVLLYVAGLTFELKPAATVDLTGRSTSDANMLLWIAPAAQTVTIASGTHVSSFRGLIYAPTSKITLSSVLTTNIGGINAQGVTFTGAGQGRLGLPLPTITVTPAALPASQVNVAYSTTVTATGGTAPYTFSATGLPAGITISTGGVISGTPTATGSSAIVVTAFDATKAALSTDYTLTTSAALSIAASPVLPNGTTGVVYPTKTLTAVGGTAPYTWTAAGLPGGVTISTGGVVSGTPTVAGSFSVTVTVTDAFTSANRTSTVVIANSLAVAGPALPNGQINVAYGPATVTATGGVGPYTWTFTGLPAGLVGSTGGVVSGTPTVSGTSTVTATVTDSTSVSAQATYTVSIVPTPTTACPALTTPWAGQYYSNIALTGSPVLTRDDASPNFDWGTGSPGSGVPSDNFSARWTRTTDFAAGAYTFTVGSSDGTRLYVDGVRVLDNWIDQNYPTTPPSVTKTLAAGSHTIVVEYYDHTGAARVSFATTQPGNGVTAVAGTCNDRTYFGESRLIFTNSLPVTSMTVTIKVAITAGVTFNGNYVTFEGGNVSISHTTSGGFIVYTFTLDAAKTIVTGEWVIAAQWNGTGTLHSTAGDTWTVVTTTTSGTTTQNGGF